MNLIAKGIGAIAIAATVVAPLLYVTGGLELDTAKATLLAATFVWFGSCAASAFATPAETPTPSE
ncbi:MAG: hypothetical protein AAGJ46_10355 [Planctomycetota bacterium]